MTTLITGGAGFIGSHLAARMLQENKSVVLLDNFDDYYSPDAKRARVKALGDVPLAEVDIRNDDAVLKVFQTYRIERVVHLAAMSAVRYSVGKAPLYTAVNTMGSVHLMDAAAKHDIEVFVMASTSSIYGQTKTVPFKEDDAADKPLAPYPASKRAAELFAHSFHNLYGLNVNVLRFFNVYGPDGRPDMMPIRALKSILHGEPIHMWDAGELERDWTYVDDTVAGIMSAMHRPLGFQQINLGYGQPIAFKSFVTIYEQLIGKEAVKIIEDAPPTEPKITYCDNSRARELLDFQPKIGIEEGLQHVWEWYRKTHNI